MQNAITYLLQSFYTISNNNYQVFYDFNNTGSNIIHTITGNVSLSGIVTGSNVNKFYTRSGLANFSGNSVLIDNTSGYINYKDCTYFLTFNRKASGDFCLLNSIETGRYLQSTYYKGYEFGVTANNYLYFNYYTNNGPQTFVSNGTVTDKSNVYLTVNNNLVQFGDYNFIKNNLNSNIYSINTEYIFDPKYLWISSNLQYTGLYNRNKPFNGDIERFIAFSPSIPNSDLRLINSGTVCNYVSGGYVTQYTPYTGITGYTTGELPYFSGVTGSYLFPTGIEEDAFGNVYTGYDVIQLTGVLTTVQTIPIYAIFYSEDTTYVEGTASVNPAIINSYSNSKINFLNRLDDNDVINVVYNTGVGQSTYKHTFSSNALTDKYYSWVDYDNRNDYQVWANGLYETSGVQYYTGDMYNKSVAVSGDYILDDNGNIIFNSSFVKSNILVDINDYNYSYLTINDFSLSSSILTHSGDKYLLPWSASCELFLNGQKLISGLDAAIGSDCDYGISGGFIYIKNTGVFYNIQNSVLSAVVYTGFSEGIYSSNLISNNSAFLPNSCKVYKNGVRLDSSYDYIEMGSFSTNFGTGIFDKKQDIIYNGNGDFN